MRVTLGAECPVYVVVDLDTGTVDKVVVSDESLDFIGVIYDEDGEVLYDAGSDLHPENEGVADKAHEIANDPRTEWPGWDFGW